MIKNLTLFFLVTIICVNFNFASLLSAAIASTATDNLYETLRLNIVIVILNIVIVILNEVMVTMTMTMTMTMTLLLLLLHYYYTTTPLLERQRINKASIVIIVYRRVSY